MAVNHVRQKTSQSVVNTVVCHLKIPLFIVL